MFGFVGIILTMVMVFGGYLLAGGRWASSPTPCRSR